MLSCLPIQPYPFAIEVLDGMGYQDHDTAVHKHIPDAQNVTLGLDAYATTSD